MEVPFITSSFLQTHNYYPELIHLLQEAFSKNEIEVPLRHHHEIEGSSSGTMLLMPAWSQSNSIGVKLVNVFPENQDIPSINGLYIHFNRMTGEPLCIIDAKSLTNKRTAAASALASSFLSRKDSKTLLLLGTGALAPDLILAHMSVRSIEEVYVWGRNYEKAVKTSQSPKLSGVIVKPIEDLDVMIPQVDIISAATMAKSPLIKGSLVTKGTHIDLVGSYKPDMREADDDLIKKSSVYVDIMEGATKESGDIVIPLKDGIMNESDILADLFGLCSSEKPARKHEDEITLFKSVGYALEDLVAGEYYYQKWLNNHE